MAPPIDLEALLVALVLAPSTYSRNRFFGLYADPAARRARRRAALIRSVVQHLGAGTGSEVEVAPAEAGRAVLRYEVPALGLKRTVALEELELAVVRFAVARAQADGAGVPAALRPELSDGRRIDAALARLLPGGDGERRSPTHGGGDGERRSPTHGGADGERRSPTHGEDDLCGSRTHGD